MTRVTPNASPSSAERFAAWEAARGRRDFIRHCLHWLALPVLLVAASLLVAYCRRPTPHVIPAKEQRSLDSLAIAKPFYEAQRAALVVHETTYVAQARRNAATALVAERAADSLHDVATAWQHAAEAQLDTSSRWYNVAVAREIENDSLRAANRSLDASILQLTFARAAADTAAAIADARSLALENLNQRLAHDVVTASREPQCRIAYVFGCPSRKEVAVLAAAGTYALTRKDVRTFLTLHLLQ
jgi:hypothetical protein